MKKLLKTALLISVFAPAAFAQEAESKWSGTADVNALFTSGNTSQSSFGLGGTAKHDSGKFHHAFSAYYDFNKNEGETDRKRFGLAYTFAYDFAERTFLTASVAYDDDEFGSFRKRFSGYVGVGYKAVVSEKINWTVEAAPSIQHTRNPIDTSVVPAITPDYETTLSALGRSSFEWLITETTKFTNVTEVNVGNRTLIENKAAFAFKISDQLSSKLSYDVMYDAEPAFGRNSTDTTLRAGISYGF